MYLEVQIENNAPMVYALDRPEIIIGSNPASGIVVTEYDISRRHLKIIKEGSDIFVIDQGSTNGTFLAGEQLIPGKRSRLEVGAPVRLGSKTYIGLVAKVSEGSAKSTNTAADTSSSADKTRVISLKDLKAQQAAQAKEKKRKLALRYQKMEKAKKKRKDKAVLNRAITIAVGLIVAGFILNRVWTPLRKKLFMESGPKSLVTEYMFKEIEDSEEGFTIPPEKLPPKSKLEELRKGPKCTVALEKHFCDKLPLLQGKDNGVVRAGLVMFFFLESGKTLPELESLATEKQLALPLDPDWVMLDFVKYGVGKVIEERQFGRTFLFVYYDPLLNRIDDVYLLKTNGMKQVIGSYTRDGMVDPAFKPDSYVSLFTNYFQKY